MRNVIKYNEKELQELQTIMLLEKGTSEYRNTLYAFCNLHKRTYEAVSMKLYSMRNMKRKVSDKAKRISLISSLVSPDPGKGLKIISIDIKLIDIVNGKLIIHY